MALATVFPRRLTPIVRYRVGDRAQWVGQACACGRTTPLFRLLGRGDDVLRIGFDSVAYDHIQSCVVGVRGLSGSVQMSKERVRGRDRLVVAVETGAPATALARLARELEMKILSQRPTLAKAVKAGEVLPVLIRCIKPGALPRNTRTGKLVRVKDL
jgi:phenylacetate-CoA ligase